MPFLDGNSASCPGSAISCASTKRDRVVKKRVENTAARPRTSRPQFMAVRYTFDQKNRAQRVVEWCVSTHTHVFSAFLLTLGKIFNRSDRSEITFKSNYRVLVMSFVWIFTFLGFMLMCRVLSTEKRLRKE